MKKHDIANNTLNFSFDNEDNEYFGQLYPKRQACVKRLTFH